MRLADVTMRIIMRIMMMPMIWMIRMIMIVGDGAFKVDDVFHVAGLMWVINATMEDHDGDKDLEDDDVEGDSW